MKPAQAKVKGRETEQALVDYLQRDWSCPYVERRRLAGTADKGDIAGIPGVVVEVKSGGRVDIPGWLAELRTEIGNAGAGFGFVAVRPKGQPHPRGWWAVLPLPEMLALLNEADLLPRSEL